MVQLAMYLETVKELCLVNRIIGLRLLNGMHAMLSINSSKNRTKWAGDVQKGKPLCCPKTVPTM